MQNAYRRWIHAPSLRGRLIWLCVSSVLVTLLVSLLVLVLLINLAARLAKTKLKQKQ